jgi:bifunctional non-homologous end joining protein LigD
MPLPAFIDPELATLVDRAPEGEAWIHEIKLDGYRMALRLADGKGTMLSRRGLDWTARFAPIATAGGKLKADTAYLDGEAVVLDERGISSFGGLQEALSAGDTRRMVYFAFDLLHLDGTDLNGLPLIERKAALERLLGREPGPILFSEHIEGHGKSFFTNACKAGLEGTISKRANAPYRSGRVGDWLKTKCTMRQEVVIGGWRVSTASPREIGSLLVGYYDHGKLRYAGGVGTGYTARMRRDLLVKLRSLSRDDSPFVDVPRADAHDARWVEPVLVAEVEFTEWSWDGRLRHPSFQGLREDKPAREVRAERPRQP